MQILTVGKPEGLVSRSFFGGNSLFHIDDSDNGFPQKLDDLDITNVRWPGGSITEGWFDPANPDVPLATPRRPEQTLDHDKILTFTEVMGLVESTNRAVDLVLPTIHILKPADANGYRAVDTVAVAEIKEFVAQAMQAGGAFPDATIASFEIGNEYWSALTSKEYGRIANVLVKAVQEGIDASGAAYKPKILVQVGDAWGPDFEAGGEYHGKNLTWGETLSRANQDIIDQIDATSRGMIDGLIDHFYTRNRGEISFESSNAWSTKKKQAVWTENGMDLGLHLTEWNMNMSGLKEGQDVFASGVGMLETFEYMVRIGAQAAHVWPISQSTSNDLTGRASGGSGHLSSNGAIFTLLSENVRGLAWQNLNIEDSPTIESSFYTASNKAVLFLAADDGAALTETIDLSGLVPTTTIAGSYLTVTQQKIIRDATQDAWVGAGAGAAISTGPEGHSTIVAVSLKPYEMIMIRLEWMSPEIGGRVPPSELTGSDGPDRMHGSSIAQSMHSLGGNDYVNGEGGNDTIWGGAGDDTLVGGAGDDLLIGEIGNDVLSGAAGNDDLRGYAGADSLYGGLGDDRLSGGVDSDLLSGNAGNDSLYGGNGSDTLYGQDGNDLLSGNDGNDSISGGVGSDLIYGGNGSDSLFGQGGRDLLSGNEGDDYLDGGSDNDSLYGGDGNDVIVGGGGSDILWGGSGDDRFYFGSASAVEGGAGVDTVFGGPGSDQFLFSGTSGFTDIMDFRDGVDKIRFHGTDVNSMSDISLRDNSKGDVVITYGGGTIRLNDITLDKISVDDFIF